MNEGIVPNDLRQSVEDIISGKKSLYEINSDTFNHAIVNVKAVYEKNVTKAIDKLTNSKTYLFNIEESKEILWDVIFLSKLVKNQAHEDKYGNKTINNSYYKDIFNQKLDINNLDSKINKVQLLLVSADLEENIKNEIKEAIVILNDLRNALAHNDNNSYETDEENEQIKFHSDSKDSELYCDIPVRYLLKLGSGIVPLPEHETLARETDIFIDYTCTNLNINLKELPNFFYEVNPENLNYILKICNYDYSKLNTIPESIFWGNLLITICIIENYCKDENGEYNISNLKDLPNYIFKSDIEILEWIIENYCKDENSEYDISKLKDLPYYIFEFDIEGLEWISNNCCKDENGRYEILKLNELPNIFKLDKKGFVAITENYCKTGEKYDISKLKYLPDYIFKLDVEILEWIIEKYCKDENGEYEILKLKDLPYGILGSNIEILEWIIENYCKDENSEYDISKLKDLPRYIFKSDIEILECISEKYCKEENSEYEISKLKGLPYQIFKLDIESIEWISEIVYKDEIDEYEISKLKKISHNIFGLNEGIDSDSLEWLFFQMKSYKDENGEYEISKPKGLPYYILELDVEGLEPIIKKYCKTGDKYDISKLIDLPDYKFRKNIETIDWMIEKYCKEDNGEYEISKLKDLPYYIFKFNIEGLEWISNNFCKEENGGYEISKLKEIPDYIFEINIEKLKLIIEKYCKGNNGEYEISRLKGLPEYIFEFDIERLELIIEKYCKSGDKYNISKLKDIPNNVIEGFVIDETTIKKIEWIIEKYCEEDNGEYDISKLNGLPGYIFFSDVETLEWIINNYCKDEHGEYEISKLKDLPNMVFSGNIEVIQWISNNYCFYNGRYDITKLKEIPDELFECDIELLKQIGKHNDMNLLKSVLGNGNDKLVALIIYMDSLFSAYDIKRKVTNLDLMNIEFDKVHPNIQSGVDSINKSYNSSNFDNVQEDYFLGDLTDMVKTLFKQFDKMGVQINEEGITNGLVNSMDDKIQNININLIRMLRNASQHFRVEVDEEENSNMLIISDYEKEFDFGNISKNVKSISKISIEDFFRLLKSIELNNEQDKTTKANYTINNSRNNLLQKVKEKYDDINNFPNKMLMTSFIHTCLKIEGYNSRKVNINGVDCISYTNGEDIFTNTVDNLCEIYNSSNKSEVFNAATLFIELIEFDKNELLLQDIFDISIIAEELLIEDGINYSKKFQNNEVIFEIDGKTKKAINIYKQYKNDKNKSHVFTEVLIDECRNAYGNVYSKSR